MEQEIIKNDEEHGQTYELSYNDLFRYEKENLSLVSALSEFIDNSISSWETMSKTDKPKKLKIEISYDYSDEENMTLTIKDNAGGMNKEELEDAMKTSNFFCETRRQNKKNQYGLGMKMAGFWFGRDVDIITKKHKYEQLKGSYNASLNGFDPEKNVYSTIKIFNDSEERFPYGSGTEIKISYIINSKNRKFNSKDKIDNFSSFFGFRYFKYIKQEEIEIKIIDSSNKENVKIIRTWKPEVFNIKNIENKNDNQNFNLESYIEKQIQQIQEEDPSFLDTSIANNLKVSQIVKKLKNKEDLVFEDLQMTYQIGQDNITWRTDLIILAEASKNNCGIATLHAGRYINQPCVNSSNEYEPKMEQYLKSFEKDLDGRTRWFYFNLEIETIDKNKDCEFIFPEKNKKYLIVKGNEGENIFEAIKDKYKSVAEILIKLHPIFNIYDNIKKEKEKEEKLNNIFNDVKYNKNDDSCLFEDKFFSNIKQKEFEYNIQILKSSDNNLKLFRLVNKADLNDIKQEWKFEYNSQSAFFNKLFDKTKLEESSKILIIKLLCDLYIQNEINYEQPKDIVLNSINQFLGKIK